MTLVILTISREARGQSAASEDASLEPADVDVLVANGMEFPEEDVQESLAVDFLYSSAFKKLHVTAVKPVTGNLVYGTEALRRWSRC